VQAARGQKGSPVKSSSIAPRIARGVALLRAAGFTLDDIAAALLAEGAALSFVSGGKDEAIARLTAMAAHMGKRP
jgi:hypothetical protein